MFATKPLRALGLYVLLCVSLVLFGEFTRYSGLVYFFKPLATILMLLLPVTQWLEQHSSYAFYIFIGLFFSLSGDVFLMFHQRFFIHGLIAFLLAHITYLIAFSRDVKFPARLSIWFLYLAFGATLYILLLPHLPANLKIPVAFYSFLLTSMAAQAMGRFLILKNNSARSVAIGAVFFMLSDSLLSLDRFHSAIFLAPVLILIPYYLAQWLIAISTISNHDQCAAPVSSCPP